MTPTERPDLITKIESLLRECDHSWRERLTPPELIRKQAEQIAEHFFAEKDHVPTERPDPKEWALRFGHNAFHLTMPEMIAETRQLMAACYRHAAAVAMVMSDEFDEDGRNAAYCLMTELERLAGDLEKGE